ncbi:hypothetical protein ACFX15_029898 [Malus domestica]
MNLDTLSGETITDETNEFVAMSNLKWESIETLPRFSFLSLKFLQPHEPEVEIKDTRGNMAMPTLVERCEESGALRWGRSRGYPSKCKEEQTLKISPVFFRCHVRDRVPFLGKSIQVALERSNPFVTDIIVSPCRTTQVTQHDPSKNEYELEKEVFSLFRKRKIASM